MRKESRKGPQSEWTSIAVRKDTRDRLEIMKVANFDDVIRRGMNMPPIKEDDTPC